jgi:hypothetical protein
VCAWTAFIWIIIKTGEWQALVKAVIKLRVTKFGDFLEVLRNYQILKKDYAPCSQLVKNVI